MAELDLRTIAIDKVKAKCPHTDKQGNITISDIEDSKEQECSRCGTVFRVLDAYCYRDSSHVGDIVNCTREAEERFLNALQDCQIVDFFKEPAAIIEIPEQQSTDYTELVASAKYLLNIFQTYKKYDLPERRTTTGKMVNIIARMNTLLDLVKRISYEILDGYLFAGYFLDEEYTTAATSNSDFEDKDSLYAKYISDDYLCMKFSTVSSKGVITKIRLISATDCKDYSDIGFIYEYSSTKGSIAATYATSISGKTAKMIFGGDVVAGSKLITADLSVSDMEADTEITATAYWITLSGSTVYGTPRTIIYTGDGISATDTEDSSDDGENTESE